MLKSFALATGMLLAVAGVPASAGSSQVDHGNKGATTAQSAPEVGAQRRYRRYYGGGRRYYRPYYGYRPYYRPYYAAPYAYGYPYYRPYYYRPRPYIGFGFGPGIGFGVW